MGRVPQLGHVFPHGEIAPPALRAPRREDPRRLQTARPTAQTAVPQALQVDDECAGGLIFLDLHDQVGFQSQRFPDKRFHAHRPSTSCSKLWSA